MIDLAAAGLGKFDWWQDWRGECAAIVAAGPSAKTAGVEALQNRIHVIAINESHKLCPWADILYCCDADWWKLRAGEVRQFPGVKLMLDNPPTSNLVPEIARLKIAKEKRPGDVWINEFLFDQAGIIGSGGNSGFQMVNLAAQFGATAIALVGFDMRLDGGVHWHGRHPPPLRNPDHSRFAEWRKYMDDGAPKLASHGIDVVNCSAVSALAAFPKLTIEQTLERWGL